MPWNLSHVLAAGTKQFTTPSSLLWMFRVENYADQSLDRRQKLIGMRRGMRFFIYGMMSMSMSTLYAPLGRVFQAQEKIVELLAIVIKVPQQYFGRPLRLCPFGCQAKTLLIQRCPGSVAKYCAKFQWCRRQIADHDRGRRGNAQAIL